MPFIVVLRAVGVIQLNQAIVIRQMSVGFPQTPGSGGGRENGFTIVKSNPPGKENTANPVGLVYVKGALSGSPPSGSLLLLHLTGAGLLRTAGAFDSGAHVDVVVVVAAFHVVEAAVRFGEGRQIEGEFCGETDQSKGAEVNTFGNPLP